MTETIEVTALPPALQTEATQMGGTLEATSTRGEGSSFALLLTLPVAVKDEQPESAVSEVGSFDANFHGVTDARIEQLASLR